MEIFKDKKKLQSEILGTKGVSFVPTMGGLHKGHISLIKNSKKTKLKTLVSIFVILSNLMKKKTLNRILEIKRDLKILRNLKLITYIYLQLEIL